jgi:hypothetical protein
MLASIKAKLAAVKAYLVAHWKQLVGAAVTGKYSGAILSLAVSAAHQLGKLL